MVAAPQGVGRLAAHPCRASGEGDISAARVTMKVTALSAPHAWLIEAEGQISECDADYGPLRAYPREFIISRIYSAEELPLARR